MKKRHDESDGDHDYHLRLGFFPIVDPISTYPHVWFHPEPSTPSPDVSGYDIIWWRRLRLGMFVDDVTMWCNSFDVSYHEDVIEYADSAVITDVEYRVDGEWYTGEQVGWMYAAYAALNVLSLGLLQDAWSKQWRHTFEGFYHARRYVRVVEYRWTRSVKLHIGIDCNGYVEEYNEEKFPVSRPEDIPGRETTLIQEFDGNVNEGDPNPTGDSWIGTTVNNIGAAIDAAPSVGVSISPTVTVGAPGETEIKPLQVMNHSETQPIIPEDSPLALPKLEELLTSYQIIVELNDPDGATAIAAFPTDAPSNVNVALKGSYAAGPYSHPGYTIDQLRQMQVDGTVISREEFYSVFGIQLPAGVSGCTVTNVNIDEDTAAGHLYGSTTYTPGIYVGSQSDTVYYPSDAKEGTITVVHR